MITQQRLKELLDYEPVLGEFRWKVDRGMFKCAGKLAGYKHPDSHTPSLSYLRIEIEGREYGAHRLAWLYVYGVWPAEEIDHINRNSLDNRIANLRDVSKSVNKRNAVPYKGRLMKGVYPNGKGFQALVRINKKLVYGGTFDTPERAFAAANTLRVTRNLPLEAVE